MTNRISRATIVAVLFGVALVGAADVCGATESASLLHAPRLLPRPRLLEDCGLGLDLYYNPFYAATIDGGSPSPDEEPH
ncbi:MAG TPA: hypothetical protein VFO62_12040, partial [Candidatus Binatia bacterium]|nr:hypothetical protein [Candidatus Binatia bacterium]